MALSVKSIYHEAMNLKKFEILSTKAEQSLHIEKVEMLLNLDHIISMKPIKIVIGDSILDGYWIRTSNGKKYKASKIPPELAEAFNAQELAHHIHSTSGSQAHDFEDFEESFH